MPHSFEIPRRRRLGVRQLAAAFRLQFFAIQIGNHKGASKLAHSKGFAFDKNYAALGETPAQVYQYFLSAFVSVRQRSVFETGNGRL
jgi:hypothetical protein